MRLKIPVYVSAIDREPGGYSARPLFHASPERSERDLGRLMTKLARDIVKAVEALSREDRQDAVATWFFDPSLTQHRLKIPVQLRRRRVDLKLLFVRFQHMGKRLAFTPSLPELWFEVPRGSVLLDRATTVINDHFRTAERESGGEVQPEAMSLVGKAWVQPLEVSIQPAARLRKSERERFLSIGDESPVVGEEELIRVGRCLDWLFPDHLDRAVLRETEVAELTRLTADPDRPPVLLCGPSQSGKTTIVHETVYRRVEARRSPHLIKNNFWLVSPQRLISGMSYVGQWEARLTAILKTAAKRNHVLYFDDLVGLFLAGQSANSTLNVAQVMKPYLERRSVRILGEITPEAFRVLQERDRGFADLFHIVPVRPPTDAENIRMLIDVQRRLEAASHLRFELDVLPTVIDVQRRYDRFNSFPGKAARVLSRLAVRAEASPVADMLEALGPSLEPRYHVGRHDVLNEFQSQSGLSLAFLDDRARLDRDDILEGIRAKIIGQELAVRTAADSIATAKARLNDPHRPLGVFLFLGPTGVGKTETAKAIAHFLFGGVDRLVRIDMNEFVDPGSSTRLVGSFNQPEGLLTAAVRRRPFAIILLDEIEKAHPEAFDLLLQVLGEGRLTDAQGRTVDFTNTFIIMTSNLGVREMESRIGFRDDPASVADGYRRAAERFFRPEFFNRLDAVVPFQRLTRDQTRVIADRLVQDVLNREGFRQRRCVLDVHPRAIERMVDTGFDPSLGARAMRRAIERELTVPAAMRLSAAPIEHLTLIHVDSGDGGLVVDVRPIPTAPRIDPPTTPKLPLAEHLDRLDGALAEIEERLEATRPRGAISSKTLTPEQERYFVLREVADRLNRELTDIFDRLDNARVNRLQPPNLHSLGRRSRDRVTKVSHQTSHNRTGVQHIDTMVMAIKLQEVGVDLESDAEIADAETLRELDEHLALLRLIADAPVGDHEVYVRLTSYPRRIPYSAVDTLAEAYATAWSEGLLLSAEALPQTDESAAKSSTASPDADTSASVRIVRIRGSHARRIVEWECGTHLFSPQHGNLVPVVVTMHDTLPDLASRPDPGSIVRIYIDGGNLMDLPTGLTAPTTSLATALAEVAHQRIAMIADPLRHSSAGGS